jgi:hypothetical protein
MPVTPDVRVYGVALLLALVSGFLLAAVPVRQVLQIDPDQIVKSGSLARVGQRFTMRDLLLGAQIAICAVLVTSSMVAVGGLMRSLHSNFGYEPQNAMLVNIDVGMAGYNGHEVAAMRRRMIGAMETIPGVTSVGLVGLYPPLHLGWDEENVFSDKTTDLRPSNAAARSILYSISPEYFRAAGTALLSGRAFTWHDDKNAPRVAVVNQVFAKKMFGSATKALGQYFKMDDGARIQVVGIAEDGKYTANITEKPQLAMFLPILQSSATDAWLVVRSSDDEQQWPQPYGPNCGISIRDCLLSPKPGTKK